MAYEDLLIHNCDIYKLGFKTDGGKYGAPVNKQDSYPEEPTYSNVKCFFAKKGNSLQDEDPGVRRNQRFMVQFLPSVDISLGDILVWNGIRYKAEEPIPVRGHHIEVEVVREHD